MREFFIQITDVVENGELTAHTTPSIINKAGIAGEHNASRLIFSLPESWGADWEYQVECVNSTNEGTVSEPLTVSEDRKIVFDIPQGMTQAGQGNYTLQGTKREDGEVVSIYRSATVDLYFAKSPKLGTKIVNAIESVLSGLFAKINDLVDRFNAGEFNGKDGKDGEKGEKGDKGDKGDRGEDAKIPVVSVLPEIAEENDICILAPFNTLTTEDSGKKIYFKWEEFAEPRDEFTDVYITLLNKGKEVFVLQMVKAHGVNSAYLHKFVGDISYETRVEFTDGYFGESYVETEEGKTYFNSISELPSYIQLPAFDSVTVNETTDVPMFYTEFTPMIYIDGWTKIDEESHFHTNKALLDTLTQEWVDSIVSGGGLTPEQAADLEANTAARHTHINKELLDYIGYDDGRLLINDDIILTDSTGVTRETLDICIQEINGNIDLFQAALDETNVILDKTTECALYRRLKFSDGEHTLGPNTFYDFGEAKTLTIYFSPDVYLEDFLSEYAFTFISGATPTVLTLPDTVKWANELTIEANKRYEISIVDNIGLWCAVEVSE